jgi:class 3 adenylate cyclase
MQGLDAASAERALKASTPAVAPEPKSILRKPPPLGDLQQSAARSRDLQTARFGARFGSLEDDVVLEENPELWVAGSAVVEDRPDILRDKSRSSDGGRAESSSPNPDSSPQTPASTAGLGMVADRSSIVNVSAMVDGVLTVEFGGLFSASQQRGSGGKRKIFGLGDSWSMPTSTVSMPTSPVSTLDEGDKTQPVAQTPVSMAVKSTKAGMVEAQKSAKSSALNQFLEHKCFTGTFMLLTFFALFAPDLDVVYGNRESEIELAIATTVVFGLFFLEMVLQSCAKPRYFPRSPFFLDLIALLSIIPDTYFWKMGLTGDALIAARPSSFDGLTQVSRNTRAFRLNRLFRIVKVVALVPRVSGTFLRRGVSEQQVRAALKNKLQKIFTVLDEDMDGSISQDFFLVCLKKLREEVNPPRRGSRMPSFRKSVTQSTDTARSSLQSADSPTRPRRSWARQTSGASEGSSEDVSGVDPLDLSELPEDLVTFERFHKAVVQDAVIADKLRQACEIQLRSSNNLHKMASKHAEDVGRKVALGVLLLLLVVNLLTPATSDDSALHGLRHLDLQVRHEMANSLPNASEPISQQTREHVQVWLHGSEGPEKHQAVYYLDLNHMIVCNRLKTGQPCRQSVDAAEHWSPRGALSDIDDDWRSHGLRRDHLDVLFEPDVSGDGDMSEERFNDRTGFVAVLYVGEIVEANALHLIWATLVVIGVIILGIVVMTKDIASLHLKLTEPLRALTMDMTAIKHLQMSGVDHQNRDALPVRRVPTVRRSSAEIRLIEQVFSNMKLAIRSWGKYVPWPVVQLLLQAGVDAKQGVMEREVTLFFSDIAGFTSIVEHMPPERSMVLLSRYFQDMSTVIDYHGGVVIEFIGDAILAMYGAPVRDSDHPTNALRATAGMLRALDKINAWSVTQNPPLPQINIRCGMHTGTCLVGNMGFKGRIKYGVVGETANIPARLEEMNKRYATCNLMSEDMWERLDRSRLSMRPIDMVYLRAQDPPQSELVYEAMTLYLDRRFKEALPLFTDVNKRMKELIQCDMDEPSSIMCKRCQAYMSTPPGLDWDGVWTMTDATAQLCTNSAQSI